MCCRVEMWKKGWNGRLVEGGEAAGGGAEPGVPRQAEGGGCRPQSHLASAGS